MGPSGATEGPAAPQARLGGDQTLAGASITSRTRASNVSGEKGFLRNPVESAAAQLVGHALLQVAAHQHDLRVGPQRPNRLEGVGPAQRGHGAVQQDHADRVGVEAEQLHALVAVGGRQHRHAGAAKHVFGELAHRLVVVDHQRGSRRAPAVDRRPLPSRLRDRARDGGQQDAEAGAATRLALDLDRAAVAPNDSRDRRQPESATGELGGEERVEDPGARLGVHSAAGVGDLEVHVLAGGHRLREQRAGERRVEVHDTGPHRDSARTVGSAIRPRS